MQTHEDRDVPDPFLGRLKERADECMKHQMADITAGTPGEEIVDEWRHGRLTVTHRPDDEQGILRISIGGGAQLAKYDGDYCVFRGNRTACAYLLEQAAKALREGHIVGERR